MLAIWVGSANLRYEGKITKEVGIVKQMLYLIIGKKHPDHIASEGFLNGLRF